MNRGFVDIHQHLLWGMDDGARSRQMMCEMLQCARRQRIEYIFATPHAVPGFHAFDAALYEERIAEANAIAAEYGIRVLSGAEVAWTYNTLDALRQGRIPTMNKTEHVLLEFWPSIRWDDVEYAVRQMLCAGFVPIIAHVERYRCFFWDPHRAEALKQRYPVFYQVNAMSMLGNDGFLRARSARTLLHRRLADAVASDAHDCNDRPIEMLKAYRWLEKEFGAEEADRLTHFDEVLV